MTGLEHDVTTLRSFDGTDIAARRMGRGSETPLLLVDGIGTKLTTWRRAVHPLARERELLNWDLRGFFSSGSPGRGGVGAGAQARDAEAALDHWGVDRCVVAGWSSGGRIALEFAHLFPERTAGLVLVCAGYGHDLTRLLRGDLAVLLPRLAGLGKHVAPFLHGRFRRFVARPEIAGLVRQSGMIAASADTASVIEILQGFADSDPRILLETYEAISGDSAPHLLDEISSPALVIVGEHDRFTSREVSDTIARKLETVPIVYRGATHFLPLEFPERLNSDLDKFLVEIDNIR